MPRSFLLKVIGRYADYRHGRFARSLANWQQFSGPFVLKTDHSKVLMLPPDYIDAVNEQSELSFREYTKEVRCSSCRCYGRPNVDTVQIRCSYRTTIPSGHIAHHPLA